MKANEARELQVKIGQEKYPEMITLIKKSAEEGRLAVSIEVANKIQAEALGELLKKDDYEVELSPRNAERFSVIARWR